MVEPRPALHFVGFRGDEYIRAQRVFRRPDFVHIGWDLRPLGAIPPGGPGVRPDRTAANWRARAGAG